jgi:AhpC/TSA family
MRKALMSAAVLAVLVWGLYRASVWQQARAEAKPDSSTPLKVGDTAPDFTLLSFDGKDVKAVSLHDYRGKKSVALAFYVFAFTGG